MNAQGTEGTGYIYLIYFLLEKVSEWVDIILERIIRLALGEFW